MHPHLSLDAGATCAVARARHDRGCTAFDYVQMYVALAILLTSMLFLAHYEFKWTWWAVAAAGLWVRTPRGSAPSLAQHTVQ
jgi:hypothetical protein